jgi:hypothetical protein
MHSVGLRMATVLHGLGRRVAAGIAAGLAGGLTAAARLMIGGYLISMTGRKRPIVGNRDFAVQIDSRPYQAHPARLDLARFRRPARQDSTSQQPVDTAATVSVLPHARDHKDGPAGGGRCRKMRHHRRRNSNAIEPCAGNRRRR